MYESLTSHFNSAQESRTQYTKDRSPGPPQEGTPFPTTARTPSLSYWVLGGLAHDLTARAAVTTGWAHDGPCPGHSFGLEQGGRGVILGLAQNCRKIAL